MDEDADEGGLFNNQHYNIALNKRNLNARLKPSVYPSKSSGDIDAVTRKRIVNQLPPSSGRLSSDVDFLKSLTSRIKHLETEASVNKHNLSMKDVQIDELTNKLKKQVELQEKNDTLVRLLGEMVDHMNKCNIDHKWKGKSFEYLGHGHSSSRPSSRDHNQGRKSPRLDGSVQASMDVLQSKNNVHLPQISKSRNSDENIQIPEHHPIRINFEVVKQKIKELNSLVQDQHVVQNVGNIRKLVKKPQVNVVFYNNGITVGEGAFRPYDWDLTKAFLNDIADGYFPYEFKDSHPDGVLLNPVDRSDEKYTKTTDIEHKLDNATKSSNIRDLDYIKLQRNVDEAKAVDKDTFLRQLPKSVIKNGKIIPVRDEIEEIISGKQDSTSNDSGSGSGPVSVDVETECSKQSDSQAHNTHRKRTLLKITTNNQQFTLQMFGDETVGSVKTYLRSYLGSKTFQIRTIYPPAFLSDDSQTLEELHLVPNAKLILIVQ